MAAIEPEAVAAVAAPEAMAARRPADAAAEAMAAAMAASGNWLRVEGCDSEGDHRITDSQLSRLYSMI